MLLLTLMCSLQFALVFPRQSLPCSDPMVVKIVTAFREVEQDACYADRSCMRGMRLVYPEAKTLLTGPKLSQADLWVVRLAL